ncbi:hypothetical protein MD484_g9026, partial [Candolleomyces efflorescens]
MSAELAAKEFVVRVDLINLRDDLLLKHIKLADEKRTGKSLEEELGTIRRVIDCERRRLELLINLVGTSAEFKTVA